MYTERLYMNIATGFSCRINRASRPMPPCRTVTILRVTIGITKGSFEGTFRPCTPGTAPAILALVVARRDKEQRNRRHHEINFVYPLTARRRSPGPTELSRHQPFAQRSQHPQILEPRKQD